MNKVSKRGKQMSSNTRLKKRGYVARDINPENLVVREAYQRFLNKALAKSIAENYDPLLFLPLVVGKRTADGSLNVVDGQTRRDGAISRGMQEVPCLVFRSDGTQHEARVFNGLNTQRKQLRFHEIFKARLIEGDLSAVAITAQVEQCGFEVLCGNHSRWPKVAATRGLERAYETGQLPVGLKILQETWPLNDDALRADIIHATCRVVADGTDTGKFVKKLSRVLPNQLILKAQSISGSGYMRIDAICKLMKDMCR